MLNRETGVKPVLSRSCNAELVLKCHWETGKARRAMKQSQKNCLIAQLFDAFLYLYAEERFILFQGQKLLNKCRNNMGNGCG